MSFIDKARHFLHLEVPAVVDEQAGAITVPSFAIPLDPELPEPCIEGVIEVEVKPEDKTAIVKVKLKKKAPSPKPLAKSKSVKKTARKR